MLAAKIKRVLVSAGLIFGVFVVAAPFNLFVSNSRVSALASTQYKDIASLEDRAKFNAYYYLMQQCFEKAPIETNASKVAAGQLFYDQFSGLSSSANIQLVNFVAGGSDFGANGTSTCGATSSEFSVQALKSFGISALELVCAMGYTRNVQGGGAGCTGGTNDFDAGGGAAASSGRADKFKAAIASLTGWTAAESIADGSVYTYDRMTLITACTTGSTVKSLSGVPANMQYDIPNIAPDGTDTTDLYIGTADHNYSWKVNDYGLGRSCGDVLSGIKSNLSNELKAYKQAMLSKALTITCTNKGYSNVSGGGVPGSSTLAACISGGNNKTTLNYCRDNWKDTTYQGAPLSREAERNACLYGQTTKVTLTPVNNPTANQSSATPTSCTVDQIGWMVCPILNAMGGFNDLMYGWIESVLVLNPLQTVDSTTGKATPQYANWQIIRDIANVLLVIVFLIVIFSQATSVGISNYGIKKMLPRIIMIAIAINVSYFLMMIAIDVTNLLGVGLHNLLNSTAVSGNHDNLNFSTLVGSLVTGVSATIGGVAIGVAAASFGSATLGTLALLALPFIAVAALSLLAAVATLFVRNALVIVLVVIAPIALAAYLLPNTENLFDKWRKLLISMLILFPSAALLFAGAKFAAYIVLTSNQPFSPMIAVFIMAAPLGALPWLLSQSNSILSSVNGRLQKLAQSARNPLTKALEPRVSALRAEARAGRRDFLGRSRSPTGSGRRTMIEAAGQSRDTLKLRAHEAEGQAEQDMRERGLAGGSKSAQRLGHLYDEAETLGLRKSANDGEYKTRLNRRVGTAGSYESGLSSRQADATTTSTALEETEKARQLGRVQRNERSTIIGGGAGTERIGNLQRQQFTASKQVGALEAGIEEANKRSGVANTYIQQEKVAQDGIKTIDAQQESVFKLRQESDAGLIANSQAQYVAKELSDKADANVNMARQREAQTDSGLIALRQERENALAETAGIDTTRATELKERTATDANLRNIELNRRADEQAGKVAADESLSQYAEAVSTDGSTTQRRAGGNLNPDEGQAKAGAFGIDARASLRAENVKAYTTRLKEQNIPDIDNDPLVPSLVNYLTDETRPDEEREAAARAIINGGNIDAIEPALDYITAEMSAADAAIAVATDPATLDPASEAAARKRISELEPYMRAVGETIGSSPGKPISLGAGEIAALKTASYRRPSGPVNMSAASKPAFDALGASEQQLATTVAAKGITDKSVPGIDKRNLASILKLAREDILPADTAAQLWLSFDAALSDPDIYTDIKGRESGYILRAMDQLKLSADRQGATPPLPPARKPRYDRAGNAGPALVLTDLAIEHQTP